MQQQGCIVTIRLPDTYTAATVVGTVPILEQLQGWKPFLGSAVALGTIMLSIFAAKSIAMSVVFVLLPSL